MVANVRGHDPQAFGAPAFGDVYDPEALDRLLASLGFNPPPGGADVQALG
jgi:hypothetical protein